ncbi:MAG: c-type cytochrome [Beijerinckiaceae bacterium]
MKACRIPRFALICLSLVIAAPVAWAALRGHGGPVRALAISADGNHALTGSFDSAAIVWSLHNDAAQEVLRFHGSAVNAVTFMPDGRLITAGEDGKMALWRKGNSTPDMIFTGHTAPISAVAADGAWIASASWDRTVRLWHIATGEKIILEGHGDNVNAVAFSADGAHVISAGYDATVRLWPRAGGTPKIIRTPSPVNALAVARDGAVITAHADGQLRMFQSDGTLVHTIEAAPAPLISLALSPDGKTIAAAGLRGAVVLINRADPAPKKMLVGPALPVWALAFTPDGRTILAAGSDRLVRRWDAATGAARDGTLVSSTDELLKKYAADPGAQIFRACVACHTLTPDDDNRAGPTLHGLFGRRIATAPGYHYSDALKKMDVVWTAETVARLFEVGPMAYTPGTKMPEQTVSNAQDRADLIAFLQRATQ